MVDTEIHCEGLKTTFKGVAVSESVVQFRRVKYAAIPKRLARSELVTSYDSEVVDTTEYGPNTVGRRVPPGIRPEEMLFGVKEQDSSDLPPEDEFESLNLTITIPKQRGEKPLPVFVNIPGGGNMRAANGALKLFDYKNFVEFSVKQGKPIIAVHVPYRVGLLGYGLLPDGTGGNNGLFDQRTAFEWIKRNIGAFGGDPENITAGGESAGGMSVDSHLQAKDSKPLFRRAVLSSGTICVLRPEEPEQRIEKIRKAAAALGVDGEDWPQKFLELPVEKVIDIQEHMELTGLRSLDDGEWYPKGIDLDKPVVPSWVESIIIGDCGFEGFIWAAKYIKATNGSPFFEFLKGQGELGQELLTAYNGIAPEAPGKLAIYCVLNLLQDIFFSHPNDRLIDAYVAASKPAYKYLFDQNNPWVPETHRAHHACDLLYWFNGYPLPTEEDQRLSDVMKSALINFSYGEAPWTAGKPMTFGPDGIFGETSPEEVEKRRRPDVLKILDKYPIEQVLQLGSDLLNLKI